MFFAPSALPARLRRSAGAVAVLTALTLTLAGCSGGTVKKSQVEEKAETALGEKVGTTPEVSCPDDLEAKEGATLRCELSVPGDDRVYGMTVTAKKVDGKDVSMGFEVDQQPKD